jgi:hypothetical protein
MGGGLWTAMALTLVYEIGWMKVFLISALMLILWAGCAAIIKARNSRR